VTEKRFAAGQELSEADRLTLLLKKYSVRDLASFIYE